MRDILLITNKTRGTGIGAYSYSLYDSLQKETNRSIDLLALSGSSSESGSAIKDFPQSITKLVAHSGFSLKKPPKYKIYHFLTPNLGMMAAKLRPSVVTVHDISPLKRMVSKEVAAASHGLELPMVLGMQLNMHFIKNADRILSVSNFTKNDLISTLGIDSRRIVVSHPGIDHSLYKPRDKSVARGSLGLPLNKPILLHVGTDEPRKNTKTLIEAFSRVKQRIPDAVLVKVGGLREETKQHILSRRLEDSVIHIRKVANVAPFYNAADLFVFPSYYEGFGFPAAEAMASGCPVIAADTSSLTEVVGKSGVILPPFDVDAFSEAICQVLSDAKLKSSLIEAGIEQATMFSWKKCAETTLELYKTL